MPTWNLYFADIETGLELIPDSEWFAAVTWEAADKRRHGWMYLQRVDRAYPKEWTIDDHPDSREKSAAGVVSESGLAIGNPETTGDAGQQSLPELTLANHERTRSARRPSRIWPRAHWCC
jgi:hypothetical protein